MMGMKQRIVQNMGVFGLHTFMNVLWAKNNILEMSVKTTVRIKKL